MATARSNVKDAWRRIEAWLQAHDSSGQLVLPPGATPDEIARAEAALETKLPRDVRESYAVHNGSDRIWIFEQGYLLPLTADAVRKKAFRAYNLVNMCEQMSQLVEMMKAERSEPNGPIKPDWWNIHWIPLTDNQCGDCLCIDMDPARGGRVGQVIDWWHERGATSVLAGSFAEFLTRHADELEAGKYQLSDVGAVVKINKAK